MIQTRCLSPVQLRAYLQGTLPDDASGEIEVHLQSCDRCSDSATQMESNDDSLIRHLRLQPDAAETDATDDQQWSACLERLRQVPGRAGNTASEVETVLHDRLQPKSIYHYRLDGVIGRGGMGVVYRGWHPQLHRAVAIKILSASRADDSASVTRFQREMRAAGSLDHPAIVRALDAGVWNGTYYLVMEHVAGVDLARLVQLQGPLGVGDACSLIVTAAEALQYAHDHQVIHRDIKPSNLMLASDGQLKILDFGLARLEHAGMTSHAATSAGRLIGTLDYLAPEQAGGDYQIDGRADVYGLGATLFKLLAGEPPHGSSSHRPILDHLQRLTGQDAARLDQFRQDLPAELVGAVSAMLERDPDQRIGSAAAVADRLRPFAVDSGLPALGQETLAMIDRLDEDQSPPGVATDGSPTPGSYRPDESRPPAKPATAENRRWDGVIKVVLLILLATILGGWAGVIIVLKTGEGELTVESEVDDIVLELLPNGASVPSLQVRAGQTTTIRSGRYELRVAGATDSVTVDPGQIVVRRGDLRVVTIRKKAAGQPQAAAPDRPAVAATPPVQNAAVTWEAQLQRRHQELTLKLADQLANFGEKHPAVLATRGELEVIDQLRDGSLDAATHKGRTYTQWRQIVLRETETNTVLSAIRSLVRLSQADQHDQTIEILFRVAEKIHGELPSAMAARDAHIHLNAHWGQEESDASGREYFRPGPRSWTPVMSQLVMELNELPPDAIDRNLRATVAGKNETEQLLVIAFLASRLQADKPFEGGSALIDQLASGGHSELVTAVAMFVQLTLSKAPVSPQHIEQLKRNTPLVASAVLSAMLSTDQFTATEDMGRVAASDAFQVGSKSGFTHDKLVMPVFDRQFDATGPHPKPEETAFLRAYGKYLVREWEAHQTESLPRLFSVFKLGALDLLDEPTRQLADRQLSQRIKKLLAERAELKTLAKLKFALSKPATPPWLLDYVNTLLHVRGEFPNELRTGSFDPQSNLGSEFADWKMELDTQAPGEDGQVWMIWYPLETTEVYLREWGREPKPSELRFSPGTRSVARNYRSFDVLPEVAIAVAATRTTDVELQNGLAISLQSAIQRKDRLTWVKLPKYGDLLQTIALQSVVPSARAAALSLAQRGGLNDAVCKRIAFELLEAELSQTYKELVLATLAHIESLELTPPVFDQLLAIIGRRTRQVEPYIHLLMIMEHARVVTPKGLTLLRASLGSRELTVQIPQDRTSGSRISSRFSEAFELKFAAPSVPPALARQALTTVRALGLEAKEARPALEAMMSRIERFAPSSSSQLYRELDATIKLLQAEPPPPENDPAGEKSAPEPAATE